jgi:4-amino-4-deoxy-L-arabinose transferase-like glycosyltransferase
VCWLLGVSEATVLLPSMLISSSFPLMSYVLLVRWGYARRWAFLGGLLVATAPFEVVLGTCRTNDLVLAGALGVGFTLLVLLEQRPVWQGCSRARVLVRLYVKLARLGPLASTRPPPPLARAPGSS